MALLLPAAAETKTWRDNTAQYNQLRRFLECIKNEFLTQVIKEPGRGDVLLDQILTNMAELIRDMNIRGNLAAVTMRWYCSGS